MRYLILVFSMFLLNANAVAELPLDEDEGCHKGQMEQFGQYLGSWKIQDFALARDGGGWSEQDGAVWNFVCIGNGVAIQDFWMPNEGGVGTNLRMYNQERDSWDIAWSSTRTPHMSHIQATEQESGNILMTYVFPKQMPDRRITFFPAEKNKWKWRQEISTDGGKTWLEVYRIEAARILP